MRKLITTILTIIAVSACRPELSFLPESFHSPDAEISGDENAVSLVFSPKAGTASLSLESSRDWTASFVNNRARGWCSIPSESGGSGTFTLTIAVQENDTYDERVAVILLRSGNLLRSLVVTQKQRDALLLSPGRIELAAEGGDFTVDVITNIDFTLSTPADASWLHKVETKGLYPHKVAIAADPNTDLKPRQAVLTVTSSQGKEEVFVYQKGEAPALVISELEVDVPSLGSGFDVQITSNLDIETEILPATCDWVEEVKTKMISTNTYYFLAAPNETKEAREMSLVFRNAAFNLSDTLHVRQAFQPGFSFTTTRSQVKVPFLREPGQNVCVFWGDGTVEPYAPDLVHTYAAPGVHTVVVEGDPVAPVRFSDWEDGMVIDLRRTMIKKEEK